MSEHYRDLLAGSVIDPYNHDSYSNEKVYRLRQLDVDYKARKKALDDEFEELRSK